MTDLLLRKVTEPRAGAEGQDDYDVIGDVSGGHGLVIGRIFRASTAPAATPWMWTLAYGQHEDRTPTHRYAASREAATFAKCWRRE